MPSPFRKLSNDLDLINEFLNSEVVKKAALTLGGVEEVRDCILTHGMDEFMSELNIQTSDKDEAYFDETEISMLEGEAPIHNYYDNKE